jgi:hypothetical protein
MIKPRATGQTQKLQEIKWTNVLILILVSIMDRISDDIGLKFRSNYKFIKSGSIINFANEFTPMNLKVLMKLI